MIIVLSGPSCSLQDNLVANPVYITKYKSVITYRINKRPVIFFKTNLEKVLFKIMNILGINVVIFLFIKKS